MGHRIGIDIGGTFTDVVVMEDGGTFSIWKQDSVREDPLRGILNGLERVAADRDESIADLLADAELLVHGQTIATNALIERSGPRLGLLCTEGFRDVLYLRDGYKPDRFNVHLPHPEDFVERRFRIGIPGRIGHDGSELVALDEDAVLRAGKDLQRQGVRAIAIAYLWSMVNPAHERRTAELLRSQLDGVDIVCSSDVLPEIREWQRTSAAVLSAYITPMIRDYLTEFKATMTGSGLATSPLIMQVNGGCASVEDVIERAVNAVASGPAAAPAAAKHYAVGTSTPDQLIVVDMGGTSFDVCLLRDGSPVMSSEIQVADQPIGVNGVEVLSVGAGGGSIAWIDGGGALRVGPRSAGATPGPACYGLGGTEPTVTDANLVARRLSPEALLGGYRPLDLDLATDAIERVATPLGLSIADAASGILRIVNNNMVSAIRAVSVERGIDPRNYTLVAGGGAGGLHASDLARALGMHEVLIPRAAGGLCAFGMAVTDVRHDFVRLRHCLTNTAGIEHDIAGVYSEMTQSGTMQLAADGFETNAMQFQRHVDARYPGQVHELTIELPDGPIDATTIRELEQRFHAEHQSRFSYSLPELPVECLHWRLSATGCRPIDADLRASEHRCGIEPRSRRSAAFGLQPSVDAAVYWSDDLAPGAELKGPAIIESQTTTIAVSPGDIVHVRQDGSYLMSIA